MTDGLDALTAHISPLECLSGGASCTPLLAIIASCVVVTVRTNLRDVISGPRYVVGKLWSRSDFRMLSKLFSYPAASAASPSVRTLT